MSEFKQDVSFNSAENKAAQKLGCQVITEEHLSAMIDSREEAYNSLLK